MRAMEAQQETLFEDESAEADFIRFDIATYPSDLTLSVLHEQWRNNDIEIPEFQRAYVWKQTQASLLIESFLLGLPVPPVFFYVGDENRSIVIDGQQRITSIVHFLDGFFGYEDEKGSRRVFRLEGLSDRSPYEGKRFVDLSESDQRKLRNAVLRAINIRQLSPDGDASSMYYIFERLNTGGTPLKPQEIRNCIYRGAVVERLRELNELPGWRHLLGQQKPDKHQRDVELILRLFALQSSIATYERPMKSFLNRVMKANLTFDSPSAERFMAGFVSWVEKLEQLLPRRPFAFGGPNNSAYLEAVLLSCMEHTTDQIPDDFHTRLHALSKDDEFHDYVVASTANTDAVHGRKKLANKFLFG
jgi:hypothetical protein